MYSTCLFCNGHLGRNALLSAFPVGRRLAFDTAKGRLWVICTQCGRWNLSPLDDRWEAIEECERLFRDSRLRVQAENVGLAILPAGLELVRIGTAQRPEIAAWRYGRFLRRQLARYRSGVVRRVSDDVAALARDAVGRAVYVIPGLGRGIDVLNWLRIQRQRRRVLDVVACVDGKPAVIRYLHIAGAELIRPDLHEHWSLLVQHDRGFTTLSGDDGLRTAGKLLAAINGFGGTRYEVQQAIAKVEDAGDPDGYFARVAALALRTSWGRNPDAPRDLPVLLRDASDTERLALQITNRSFWGRGAVGSEPSTPLPHLPLIDRLALEMAANEDSERRAMEGELAELESAWREAEEIAAIADGLLLPQAVSRIHGARAGAAADRGFGLDLRALATEPRPEATTS